MYLYPQASGKPKELTEVITESKRKKRGTSITIKYTESNGEILISEKLECTGKGLFLQESNVYQFDPPIPWIKNNTKPGDKWEVYGDKTSPGALSSSYLVGSLTFERYETVKVPAGTFKAMRIHAKFIMAWEETRWYAPGVGLVKWKAPWGATIVLKSFKLGKVPDK